MLSTFFICALNASIFFSASDDEIVGVDRAPAASPVYRRLVWALLEAHLLEYGI
jgi:hypothetical protein